MITSAKITEYDGQKLVVVPAEDIECEILRKRIRECEIRLWDGRRISPEQRRKIFAIIRDISEWSGHEPEWFRKLLTWNFVGINDIEWFSLSDVDMSTAKEFITYLIEFCLNHDIPTMDSKLNLTEDIGKYLYACLYHRRCAICNAPADVHHIDRIGMGRDRNKINHIGLRAIALCRTHHDEIHHGEIDFLNKYHVYGIKLDKELCERLKLNKK